MINLKPRLSKHPLPLKKPELSIEDVPHKDEIIINGLVYSKDLFRKMSLVEAGTRFRVDEIDGLKKLVQLGIFNEHS